MMIEWIGSARRMTLGQITPGQFSDVVFSVQAFVNDVLRQRGDEPGREDGILDQATCLRVAAAATGAFGTLDPTLQQLLADSGAELRAACATLPGLPPPPPPAPEPPPGEFEQCFIGFGDTSEAIRSIQRRVNTELSARGFVPIPENGVWNSVTCGALYYLTLVQGVPAEGASSPFNIPECPGGTQVPVECPDRVTPQRAGAPATASGGGLSGLAIAGIVAAVLGVGYYVTQT